MKKSVTPSKNSKRRRSDLFHHDLDHENFNRGLSPRQSTISSGFNNQPPSNSRRLIRRSSFTRQRDLIKQVSFSHRVVNKNKDSPSHAMRRSLATSIIDSKFSMRVEEKFSTIHQLKKIRDICNTLVTSTIFQVVFVVLISINAILMGIATYYYENEEITRRFNFVDQIFLVVFTIELIIQFFALLFRFFADGWLVFDFSIIILSWSFDGTQIMRAFRTFRALRLITRVKTLKYLVEALLDVIVRTESIMLLLFIITYIFGVMLTELIKDSGNSEEYFGSLPLSLFTLFRMMTFDSWGKIPRQVMLIYPWIAIPMILYVIFSGILLMNLIIAVLYDSIKNTKESNKKKMIGNYRDSINGSMKIDKNDNGAPITIEAMKMEAIRERIQEVEEQINNLEQLQKQLMNIIIEILTRPTKENQEKISTKIRHEENIVEYEKIQIIIPPDNLKRRKNRYTLKDLRSMNMSIRIFSDNGDSILIRSEKTIYDDGGPIINNGMSNDDDGFMCHMNRGNCLTFSMDSAK